MKKMKLFILMAVVFSAALVGCKDEPTPPANIYLPENYYEVPMAAGDYKLPISIDQDFTVTSNKSWLTTAGSGSAMNGDYTFTVQANDTDRDYRTGYLTFSSSGGVTSGVTIKQMQNNAIDVYSNDLASQNRIRNIGSMGGEYEFAVLYGLKVDETSTSKSDIKFSIPAEAQSWISVELRTGRNNVNNPIDHLPDSVVVIVSPNDMQIEERECIITFTNGDYNVKDEVVFHQTAEPTFELATRTYEVSKSTTSLTMDLRSNAGFNSVTTSEGWVTLPASFEDIYDKNFNVTLAPNTTGAIRSAVVTFVSTQNQTFQATIHQMAHNVIMHPESEINVSGVKRTYEVDILPGIIANISSDEPWISFDRQGSTAYITVEENSGALRSGTITFTDASNSSVKDVVAINQDILPTFTIEDDIFILPSYASHVAEIKINYSHPYQIRNFAGTWLNMSSDGVNWSESETTTSIVGESLNGPFFIKPISAVSQDGGVADEDGILVRSGKLSVISEGVIKDIQVKQIRYNVIDIPSETIGVSDAAITLSYGIVDGISYTTSVEGTQDWITVTSDPLNEQLVLDIQKNNTSDSRSVTITVTNQADDAKKDVFTVTQYGEAKVIDLTATPGLSNNITQAEAEFIFGLTIKGEMTDADFELLRGKSSFGRLPSLSDIDLSQVTNTVIPDSAFVGIVNLNNVVLPNTLKTIGEAAFHGCDRLNSVNLPASVTSIGEGAFMSCVALKDVTIPSGVTEIKPNTFRQSGLEKVVIPANVVTIGDNAFSAMATLTEVTFEENSKLKTIDQYAFFASPNLGQISLPASLETLNSFAFSICRSLSHVDIANTKVTVIAESVFSGTNLSTIELPDNTTTIGFGAFSRTPIVKITIPSSVISIGEEAFLDIIGDESTQPIVEIILKRFDANAIDNYEKITRFGANIFSNAGPPAEGHEYKLTIYVPKGSLDTYVSVVCTGLLDGDNKWGEDYVHIFRESID